MLVFCRTVPIVSWIYTRGDLWMRHVAKGDFFCMLSFVPSVASGMCHINRQVYGWSNVRPDSWAVSSLHCHVPVNGICWVQGPWSLHSDDLSLRMDRMQLLSLPSWHMRPITICAGMRDMTHCTSTLPKCFSDVEEANSLVFYCHASTPWSHSTRGFQSRLLPGTMTGINAPEGSPSLKRALQVCLKCLLFPQLGDLIGSWKLVFRNSYLMDSAEWNVVCSAPIVKFCHWQLASQIACRTPC